ncbi:MAG: SDR family oxidoreductase [Planctomycetota bacterium]|nr:MAG: SDR family oxidoreductase [Planctomycetota bacterium]
MSLKTASKNPRDSGIELLDFPAENYEIGRMCGWSAVICRLGEFSFLERVFPVSKRLEGKVAIVTGVSDRGIGGAIAERLADEGAATAILWMERPTRLIQRLTRRERTVIDCQCDVTQATSIREAVDTCMSEWGQVDILVNNAGIEDVHEFENGRDDIWERLLDVNLLGTMKMIRGTLPVLTEPDGVIVNIASVLGMAGCGGFGAYSATKSGLIGLTQSLAAELAPKRQRVVAVAPALVFTPMMQRHIKSSASEMEALLAPSHPLGVGAGHDVAAAVAFLASPEARWITGTTLPLGWMPSFPLPFGAMAQAATATPEQVSGDAKPEVEVPPVQTLPLK